MNNIKNSNYTDDIVVNYGHWFFTQPPISLRENCKFMKNVPQKIDQINQFLMELKDNEWYCSENNELDPVSYFPSGTGLSEPT